jgi:radical SAM protein with 4Fe4S-binding SPASM domain
LTHDFSDSRGISLLKSSRGDPNRIIASVIGQDYWDYRREWELARTFIQRPPFPIQVDYELFYGCNLKCPICIMSLPLEERSRWGDPAVKLSLDQVKSMLDEGAAHGQRAAGLNGICEPLMYPDLAEVVAHARDRGLVDVMFNTNGLLLDEKISRDLIQAGLTRIMISIDAASEEVYQRIRIGSDFHRVCSNVKRFVELRKEMGRVLPLVRASFCVTSVNEHELDDFTDYWAGVVDFFSIQHYGNTFEGAAARSREYLFSRNHCYAPGASPRCAQPNKRVMVRHNGDVIPCCDASGLDLVIGNVNRQSIKDIWEGPAAGRIRRLQYEGRYYDHPVCQRCMTKWGPNSKTNK